MTSAGTTAPSRSLLEVVQLEAFEAVVPHGTQRQTWCVYLDNQWVGARDVPDAVLESQTPRPGVIWLSLATLSLPRGCWLKRIVQSPRVDRQLDPLTYLRREQLHNRRYVRVVHYKVKARGLLASSRESPPL